MTDFTPLSDELKAKIRIPYALRRAPESAFASLVTLSRPYERGDVVLARVEKIGKNTGLELTTGRRSSLHVGVHMAMVFGNRYATHQFEGYAQANGDSCDMLSMGGLCGTLASKHVNLAEPTKLRLLGALGDSDGNPLRIENFALPALPGDARPHTIVVCGTSMDAGKTYTTMSLIKGLSRDGARVAGVKLTGTAAGRDLWSMIDAGACVGLDFVDGGWPSTYLCELDELLAMHRQFLAHTAAAGAEWVVIEVADGLLQRETETLLQSPAFIRTVDTWVLAAGEPMAASAGVARLRSWNIEPQAISGIVSMSALSAQEAQDATGVQCYTAKELQTGALPVEAQAAHNGARRKQNKRGGPPKNGRPLGEAEAIA
jgi:hypothetical protein